MNTYKTFLLLVTFIVVISFTGCYTQVATSDTFSVPDNVESSEVTNYYSEDYGDLESGYYAETDSNVSDDGTTIINNYYYDYPYRSYFVDYYPTISIGIGFGWGWGYWGYPYYAYYWPYYSGWCGYGWVYPCPYYCYYPSYYYYYDPYYYYPYYGYGGYPSYNGYKTRSNYVSGLRNNSGGRNYGERTRDPLVSVRDRSFDRSRDDLSNGRDLTVSRTDVRNRTSGIENKTRDLKREVVGLKNVDRNTDVRNSKVLGERNSKTTREVKQLGLEREVTTKKSIGINRRNDVSKETVSRTNTNNNSNRINQNDRIGNETKKLFGKDNSRTNNKQPNVNNRPNNNQTPKKDNNTRSYSPPKQNSNPPRTYSPPRNNSNPPRSYSPPSGNNTSRSSSPPSRSGGSNNTGSRRR